MGLKESGLRGSLRSLSTGVTDIPDSVVQQFTGENFADPWPDDAGLNDMAVSGLTATTLSDGADAVAGDGDTDHGTATLPISGSDLQSFAFEVALEFTNNTAEVVAVINDGSSRQIIRVSPVDGNIVFDLRDDNETRFQFEADNNPEIDDGVRHDILFSIIDSTENDARMWIDGGEVSVNVTTSEGPDNFRGWDYDMGYYARNDQGAIRNYWEGSIGIARWHGKAITEPTTVNYP